MLGIETYPKHLEEALAGPKDLETLAGIFKEKDWIVQSTARRLLGGKNDGCYTGS